MKTVEIVIDEDGRVVSPQRVRLRVPAEFVVPDEPVETETERAERLLRFWEETDAALADVPRKPWPKDDPIVEKFRRMGILEED